MRFCRLLPPSEDDAPDPAVLMDEPGDVATAPTNVVDGCTPGATVAGELPATGLMPGAGLAIPTSGSLVTGVACPVGAGLLDDRP